MITNMALYENTRNDLKTRGYAHIGHRELLLESSLKKSLRELAAVYGDLKEDTRGRNRSYGRYLVTPNTRINTLDLRPGSIHHLTSDYRQPRETNPEQNGALRNFSVLSRQAASNRLLKTLIFFDLQTIPLTDFWVNARRNPLLVGVHLIRMKATEQYPGVATPNHPHQDGEPCTCIHLINREHVIGGENQIFRSRIQDGVTQPGEKLFEITLSAPLDTLIVWDSAVFHHVAPIEVAEGYSEGFRDVLLIDFTPLEEAKFGPSGAIGIETENFRVLQPILTT